MVATTICKMRTRSQYARANQCDNSLDIEGSQLRVVREHSIHPNRNYRTSRKTLEIHRFTEDVPPNQVLQRSRQVSFHVDGRAPSQRKDPSKRI